MKGEFVEIIWNHYKTNKRSFPWRETQNPYFIFLSEVMLQQTQTSRVVEKYNEFIELFPTVTHLAAADFSQVLTHWSGLGYNRRAKFLWEAAKQIQTLHEGKIPHDVTKLDALPGIGYNTAAAILVYAFNTPIAFIETNIRRIYIHHFFSHRKLVSDAELLPLIAETMDRDNPREWFWALMDYGSNLAKTTTNPNRKSKHYSKQSTFTGSVRQVRGSILKLLIANKTLNKSKLKDLVEGDKAHFDAAVAQLLSEGFIRRKGQNITLQ